MRVAVNAEKRGLEPHAVSQRDSFFLKSNVQMRDLTEVAKDEENSKHDARNQGTAEKGVGTSQNMCHPSGSLGLLGLKKEEKRQINSYSQLDAACHPTLLWQTLQSAAIS